jgi:hypothetical protein
MGFADASGCIFDVFYDDALEPLLIASFEHLEDAMASMEDFASHVPGRYFVWASDEDELMAQLSTGAPSSFALL